MLHLITWMRKKDVTNFSNSFAQYEDCVFWNGLDETVNFDMADGLLLTGGEDISIEFHTETPTNASLIQETNPRRDGWDFQAVREALERQMPILAISRGMEVMNVALGGSLHLHIDGHDKCPQENAQPLRHAEQTTFKFDFVNSGHHQAVKKLASGLVVESWCATDDIAEQVRLDKYPYAIGVQYHPEVDPTHYRPLFDSFVQAARDYKVQRESGTIKGKAKKRNRRTK